MTNQTIDLDILSPSTKKVKINGIVIDVFPVRVNDLVKFQSLDKNDITSVLDVLKGIIPDIDKANPTVEQLSKLIEFVVGDSSDKKKGE